MPFPVKTCALCGEEFELRPDKPGYANRCPECSAPDATAATGAQPQEQADRERDAERRKVIREMLYTRK
jgi:hypothetical protein